MLRSRLLIAAVSCVTLVLASAENLCSITPYSYTGAKSSYPELTTAIETLENYAIASWFTDRQTTQERSKLLSGLLSQCSEDTRLSIVVYGIPNKDCAAGLSSGGSVTNTSSYKAFLKELTDAVGDRKVLYVVEPDALGLLTQDGSCGAAAEYLKSLKVAVAALSVNSNAELYVDIGYWMLVNANSANKVAAVMKDIRGSGRVKGVAINTSNYRSTDECATYCTNFQTAMGSTNMTCIVDTSRNYNGSPTSEWCNVRTAGIGKPPSSKTAVLNLDYFMWIKPPGESDGECVTGGTPAGSMYLEGFKLLWNQGYFVSEQGMLKIDDSFNPATQAPTSSNESSSNEDASDQTTLTPIVVPTSGNSSWDQDDTTISTADPISTEDVVSTPFVTTAPATTTVSNESTTQQPNANQTRSGCKAKKYLHLL
ncbi:hypothetical protein KXD40_007665 [Peronospora effusa]|uniref:Glycoside hydrolase n=1 Tax=Peronospora effusa TaxID=542832 RepID=A0A3M6VUI4_9STRA|nr:hypothetical protein DD238_003336 [Peronospora effusa]RQM18625.1 hypothetical protein DD237_001575 [Peronospora effusa]UIZ23635.1 hypothetical protein KXD40_007665 [Peronospora effusa]CAI5707377.1 unnamed protein product [Peronospora effusa]